ncbi:TlpA family protein disulfide reductase [Micromonosporaceae bacterium Da 78-11]
MTALLALLSLAGCASSNPPAANGLPPTSTIAAAPAPVSPSAGTVVPQTLRFSAKTVDGSTFDGAVLAGKPAVLWFWAAWCPKCRAAGPHVAATQSMYAGKVNFVGVAGLGSGRDKMADFVADTGVAGFPHLADDQGDVWRRFGVTAQEYFVVLDATGTVVHQGPLSRDDLRDRVAALAG